MGPSNHTALLKRLSSSALFAGIALLLIWYAVLSNRIAAKDLDFLKHHHSSRLFPIALFWRGTGAWFIDLNPSAAARWFRKTLSAHPIFIAAWIELANAELAQGNEQEAERVLNMLSPLIANVSTWKWKELLLAYDLREDKRFADAFNFVLARLPNRVREAVYLASRYWGSTGAVVPHVKPENGAVFLKELMTLNRVDAAVELWDSMPEERRIEERQLALRFCDFLLQKGRIGEAAAVWREWSGSALSGVVNGAFEHEPLNTAFGWRLAQTAGAVVQRSSDAAYEGNFSLRIHFQGTRNVAFRNVSQIVPVEGGKSYLLEFARKSRGLTTDQGVFMEISGFRCKGLNVRSEPVTGTSRWTVERLAFDVPEDCRAVRLRVRRKESLMFDNKIAGDFWLDAVRLRSGSPP